MGAVGLVMTAEHARGELGYCIGHAWWGRGRGDTIRAGARFDAGRLVNGARPQEITRPVGPFPHVRSRVSMSEARRVDPLQGITLKAMVEHLAERYGWDGLGARIDIRCFTQDPSVASSLKFLRKTPWARAKVESLYVHSVAHPRKSAGPPPVAEPGPGEP